MTVFQKGLYAKIVQVSKFSSANCRRLLNHLVIEHTTDQQLNVLHGLDVVTNKKNESLEKKKRKLKIDFWLLFMVSGFYAWLLFETNLAGSKVGVFKCSSNARWAKVSCKWLSQISVFILFSKKKNPIYMQHFDYN